MGNEMDTSLYDKWMKKIQKKIDDALQDTLRKAFPEFLGKVETRVRDIFTGAIDAFYADYTPDEEWGYERQYDLYRLLEIERDNDHIAIWFEPQNMQGFRNGYKGEDGLYDQVFRKGWHGGAGGIHEEKAEQYGVHPGYLPGGNVPVWRTPYPYYTRWGRTAEVMSPSPLEMIQDDIEQYKSGGMQSDFQECWDRHFKNIKINW